MAKVSWEIKFSLILLAMAALAFFVHYLIFQSSVRILTLLVEDLALVFVNVLLVTLVIQKLLSDREKRAKMNKLNMVIGAFFSEVGLKLLGVFSFCDPELEKMRSQLRAIDKWSDGDFASVRKNFRKYRCDINFKKVDFKDLRDFLAAKRNFMLRLLENPNLLEHESFTELLRAVFHLTEELQSRKSLANLPETDYAHLGGDMKRAYTLLILEWQDYMRYLKDNYPYLFSLAIRTNPFEPNASPVVKQ